MFLISDQARSNTKSSFHRFDFKAQGSVNVAVFTDRIEPNPGTKEGMTKVIDAMRALKWCAQPIWRRWCFWVCRNDATRGGHAFQGAEADDVRRPNFIDIFPPQPPRMKRNLHELSAQAKRNFRCKVSLLSG
jgi:hypothetical protein